MSAIGIEGQYIFIFDLGGNTEFIRTEDDLHSFIMVEEAGNVLPTFHFLFQIRKQDEQIIEKCNEGNILKVQFGKEIDELASAEFEITYFTYTREGHNAITIELRGILNKHKYIGENKIWSSSKKTGIAVMKEIAENHFGVQYNVLVSQEDEMYWIQPNITDRQMINDIWLHSYRSNSFVILGISGDNKLIIKDPKLDSGYDWKFSYKDSVGINISGDYSFESKAGFLNHWMGYGRNRSIYDLETNEMPEINESFKPIMALASSFNRHADLIDKRQAEFRPTGENVHNKWWDAYKRNLTSLALFSSTKVVLSYYMQFEMMRVLDRAMFNDDRPDRPRSSSEYLDGIYYITKITRGVANKQFNTTVELCREVPNKIAGSIG